jgi:lysophospholipase L1-like esterase
MARSSSRTIRRVAIGALSAGVAAALSVVSPVLASSGSHARAAKTPSVTPGSRYLALGDSVSFGFREDNAVPAPNDDNPKSLVGFPEDVGFNLGLKVTNASCPGETTASFLDTKAQSNGCLNHYSPSGPVAGGYRTAHPLHTKYASDTESQMTFATKFLKRHPGTRLITLMIGANDGFLCLESTQDQCASELGDLTATITKNVKKILRTLRNKDDYQGQIILVTYYSTDYSDSFATLESNSLNGALTAAIKGFNVQVADGFGQFNKQAKQAGGDTCTAGLLTVLNGGDTPCGVHPSYSGQALLAQAVERVIKR